MGLQGDRAASPLAFSYERLRAGTSVFFLSFSLLDNTLSNNLPLLGWAQALFVVR